MASWHEDRVWVAIFLNLSLITPVSILKFEFKREILRLSAGLVELGFFGLQPKTMMASDQHGYLEPQL